MFTSDLISMLQSYPNLPIGHICVGCGYNNDVVIITTESGMQLQLQCKHCTLMHEIDKYPDSEIENPTPPVKNHFMVKYTYRGDQYSEEIRTFTSAPDLKKTLEKHGYVNVEINRPMRKENPMT